MSPIRRRPTSIKLPTGGWELEQFTHPGEMLREEFMKPLSLSANKLALEIRVPATRIAEIIHERRAISADTALRLSRYFGTSAEFWLNLQQSYDLVTIKRESGERIAAEVNPREDFFNQAEEALGSAIDAETVRLNLQAPTRRAAYESLRTLLGSEPHALDVPRHRKKVRVKR